jgi:hypothetical protein
MVHMGRILRAVPARPRYTKSSAGIVEDGTAYRERGADSGRPDWGEELKDLVCCKAMGQIMEDKSEWTTKE